MAELEATLAAAIEQGRRIHFLKPYRTEHTLKITSLLGLKPSMVASYRSEPLHKAVVAQRNIKSADEVADIERAVDVSREMYLTAMAAAQPGQARVRGRRRDHPRRQGARLRPVVPDHLLGARRDAAQPPPRQPDGSRATCSCSTRVSRRRQVRQRHHAHDSGRAARSRRSSGTIYEMVLRAQMAAIAAIKPGVPYKDVHLLAAKSFATDLKAAGPDEGRRRRSRGGRRARDVLPARARPHAGPRRARPREPRRAVRGLRAGRRAQHSSSASATCAWRARCSPASC